MAHFAEIDPNGGTVLRVLVVPNEQEHRGQEYMADDLGLGGVWIQTSYNATIRKKLCGGFVHLRLPPAMPSSRLSATMKQH